MLSGGRKTPYQFPHSKPVIDTGREALIFFATLAIGFTGVTILAFMLFR